jgi:RimJ/RimL family protein N-acetyltransferase
MLSTPRLHLWSLERHDLMKNYHWANQRQLIRLTGMHPFPKTAGELERWFDGLAARVDTKIFAIKTKDGDYIGNIELRDIDHLLGRAEVGIFLAEPESRGHGYGREALAKLSEFAFQDLRLHRLYAKILEHNAPAQKAFTTCHFQLEGTERQAYYDQGRFWDVHLYGLLAPDWKEIQQHAPH